MDGDSQLARALAVDDPNAIVACQLRFIQEAHNFLPRLLFPEADYLEFNTQRLRLSETQVLPGLMADGFGCLGGGFQLIERHLEPEGTHLDFRGAILDAEDAANLSLPPHFYCIANGECRGWWRGGPKILEFLLTNLLGAG